MLIKQSYIKFLQYFIQWQVKSYRQSYLPLVNEEYCAVQHANQVTTVEYAITVICDESRTASSGTNKRMDVISPSQALQYLSQ